MARLERQRDGQRARPRCTSASCAEAPPLSRTQSFSVVTSCAPSSAARRNSRSACRRDTTWWSGNVTRSMTTRPQALEQRVEALRVGDAGEGDNGPLGEPGGVALRLGAGLQHRAGKPALQQRVDALGLAVASSLRLPDDDCIDKAELEFHRCAQRSRRDHLAVAEPARAVDDGDGEILGQRRVLQAVVHDDGADFAAARLQHEDAGLAVARRRASARRARAAAARRRSGARLRARPRPRRVRARLPP